MVKIGSVASGITEVFKCFKTGIPVVDKVIPAVCWFLFMLVFFTLMIPLAWNTTIDFLVGIFTSAPVEFVGDGVSTTAGAVGDGISSGVDYVKGLASGLSGDEAAAVDGTTGAETSVEELPELEK